MAGIDKKQRLTKLRQKKDALNAKIQQLQAQETQNKRKQDTRRKVLVGSAIYARIANKIDDWSEQKLLKMMDGFLTRDHERALFGLPQLATESSGEVKPAEAKSTPTKNAKADSAAPNIQAITSEVQQVSSPETVQVKRRKSLRTPNSDQESDLEKEFNM